VRARRFSLSLRQRRDEPCRRTFLPANSPLSPQPANKTSWLLPGCPSPRELSPCSDTARDKMAPLSRHLQRPRNAATPDSRPTPRSASAALVPGNARRASFVVILPRFPGFPVQARRLVPSPLHLGGDAFRAQPHYRIIRIDLHLGLSSSLLNICGASWILSQPSASPDRFLLGSTDALVCVPKPSSTYLYRAAKKSAPLPVLLS
jgi:hypothetical protein